MSRTEGTVHESAVIAPTAKIGVSYRRLLGAAVDPEEDATTIAAGVWIGEYVLVGKGCVIEADVILDHYTQIEAGVRLGCRTLVTYRAQICCDAIIGRECVVGGFIGERTRIGDRCRIFGSIVHHHAEPTFPWGADESQEDGATILDDVFVGFGAVVSKSVQIGPRAYVCAGSIVSRDVPAGHIAYGYNRIMHYKDWSGYLRTSRLFNV